ncbi:PLD nuclease N-terminal domain-containing protein [Micrococcus sp.]|uniref:PLD nuclease N-terminal domain-containing protein n=1 Tax=Micrococcus sp. TaxID=1271 RepID=UPI002A916ADA|nr:PLD nuclease N-terminal domain-containing protein [Micrococcus sp.]MDY6055220.1 PLD nuclease N-terminal domain-containing protein [Micrococcus sp.]
MPRLILLAVVVLIGVTLFALFEALLTPSERVRGLRKPAWIAVIVLLPAVGPVLWLLRGRAGRDGRGTARPAPRPMTPDDDEAFLRTLRAQRHQAERAKELDRRERSLDAREEELRRRRREGDADGRDEADDRGNGNGRGEEDGEAR